MLAKTHLGDCGSQVSIHIAFSPDGRYINDFVMLIFIGLNVPPPCTHTETFLLAVVMLLLYGKHYKELENPYSSLILVNNNNNDSR